MAQPSRSSQTATVPPLAAAPAGPALEGEIHSLCRTSRQGAPFVHNLGIDQPLGLSSPSLRALRRSIASAQACAYGWFATRTLGSWCKYGMIVTLTSVTPDRQCHQRCCCECQQWTLFVLGLLDPGTSVERQTLSELSALRLLVRCAGVLQGQKGVSAMLQDQAGPPALTDAIQFSGQLMSSLVVAVQRVGISTASERFERWPRPRAGHSRSASDPFHRSSP